MCLFVMCLFICSLTVLNYSTNEDKTCATLVSVNPTGNMFVCITVKKILAVNLSIYPVLYWYKIELKVYCIE